MTPTEQDIASTPMILRQTLARVEEHGEVLASYLHGPVAFLGFGSSYCIALAAASLYEAAHGAPGQATASDPLVSVVQAQLLAVRMAEARGVNPDAPHNLQRAIVLPPTGT